MVFLQSAAAAAAAADCHHVFDEVSFSPPPVLPRARRLPPPPLAATFPPPFATFSPAAESPPPPPPLRPSSTEEGVLARLPAIVCSPGPTRREGRATRADQWSGLGVGRIGRGSLGHTFCGRTQTCPEMGDDSALIALYVKKHKCGNGTLNDDNNRTMNSNVHRGSHEHADLHFIFLHE